MINGDNTNTITPVDNINNLEIVADNVANAATNAESIDTESMNTDNIYNAEIENDKSEDIVMSDDNEDNAAMSDKNKSADKMVILPPLFDGSKPEVVQHYERFNQYIKFQTKSVNIREPIAEAIELFEHTLNKKALVWFEEHKDKFVDLTTLKTIFPQRYNPWEKTKQDQLQSWNILIF